LNPKIIKSKKNIGYLLLSIFVAALSLTSIFVPQVSSFLRVGHSHQSLLEKRGDITTTKNNYTALIEQIPILEGRLLTAEENAKQSAEKHASLLANFNVENSELHIPSVIILLEQNALYFGLDFSLYHNKIREYTQAPVANEGESNIPPGEMPAPPQGEEMPPLPPTPPQDRETPPAPTMPPQDAGNPIIPTLPVTPPNTISQGTERNTSLTPLSPSFPEGVIPTPPPISEELEEARVDFLLRHFTVTPVEGMKSFIVPIKITGEYSSFREYLYFLDSVDFIEATVIEITSTGESVTAFIIFHVFSVEGGVIQ